MTANLNPNNPGALDLSDLLSFDIGLSPTGDAGSSYRTQNDPSAPLQRGNYIERKGAVDIRCSCLDVIHGLFSADGEDFATLLVLDFRFDPRKRARRIASANISLDFGSMRPGEAGPEVYAIAPNGTLSLAPTTQFEQVKRSTWGQLGGSSSDGKLAATGGVGREKIVGKFVDDETTVTGSMDLKGRNWGKPNCASWTLLENDTTKTGVPQAMRAAVLLKRQDESPFQCVVKINAKVDFKSTLEQVFGTKPKDDPVLFDPQLEPTNNLQEYDVEALGDLHLDDLIDVTLRTYMEAR